MVPPSAVGRGRWGVPARGYIVQVSDRSVGIRVQSKRRDLCVSERGQMGGQTPRPRGPRVIHGDCCCWILMTVVPGKAWRVSPRRRGTTTDAFGLSLVSTISREPIHHDDSSGEPRTRPDGDGSSEPRPSDPTRDNITDPRSRIQTRALESWCGARGGRVQIRSRDRRASRRHRHLAMHHAPYPLATSASVVSCRVASCVPVRLAACETRHCPGDRDPGTETRRCRTRRTRSVDCRYRQRPIGSIRRDHESRWLDGVGAETR